MSSASRAAGAASRTAGGMSRVAGAASRATRPARTVSLRERGLSLVPPLRTGAPRAPFVILVATLLAGGLAGLLVLHTALAEDSFRLQDLKNRSAALAAREQALEQQVAMEASPARLAAKAEAMGMVRSVNPAFIRLSDGSVLGKPRPGVVPPPPPRPSPSSSTGRRESTRADSTRAASTRPDSTKPARRARGADRDRDR